jgi:hypothetical protein
LASFEATERARGFVEFLELHALSNASRIPNYKVGEILHTCWGYDQTNIEYFEVVELRGKHVILRELAQERTATGFDQGNCAPIAGKYVGEPIRRLAQERGIKIDDCRTAFRSATTTVAGVEVHKPLGWSAGH